MPLDTRVSLQKLEVFDLVVSLGGVSRAADHLGVAQPVVSGHLRSLEQRVGCSLFYRQGRHLCLTEAGQAVHGWCTDLLRRTRELSRDLDGVSDGLRGNVAIGTSMSIGSYRVAPLLGRFRAERPGVEIRVDIIDAGHAIAETEAGENDFSVVLIESPPDNPGLQAEVIGFEELVLVGAPEDPPAEDHLDVAEVASLSFVEAQRGSLRRAFTDRELRRIGIADRRVVMELGHPEGMKRIVADGHGVCLLFRSAVERELATGELREITIRGAHMEGPIYLIRRKDKFLSTVHRDLVEALRSYLAPQSRNPPSGGGDAGHR